MKSLFHSEAFHLAAQILIGTIWVFHGLCSKLLNGIPRHRLIVGKILGDDIAPMATRLVGALEVLLGIWVFSGWQRPTCALVQTLALISMNALEIRFARSLLVSVPGMLLLNAALLALVWTWALGPG